MAPCGACEVAQSTARSNAQFEAGRCQKVLRRRNKVLSNTMKLARAVISNAEWLRSMPEPPNGYRAHPSNHVERNVRKKRRAAFSSDAEYEEACLSNDFERYLASVPSNTIQYHPIPSNKPLFG